MKDNSKTVLCGVKLSTPSDLHDHTTVERCCTHQLENNEHFAVLHQTQCLSFFPRFSILSIHGYYSCWTTKMCNLPHRKFKMAAASVLPLVPSNSTTTHCTDEWNLAVFSQLSQSSAVESASSLAPKRRWFAKQSLSLRIMEHLSHVMTCQSVLVVLFPPFLFSVVRIHLLKKECQAKDSSQDSRYKIPPQSCYGAIKTYCHVTVHSCFTLRSSGKIV